MSKKRIFKKLWVFGDSYTTPYKCVNVEDSFWGITAQHLVIPIVVNCSRESNSFESVMHLLVTMQAEINWKEDLVFVGVPPLERITVFDNRADTVYLGNSFNTSDWSKETFEIISHRGLVSKQHYGGDKELIIHNDRSWVETQALKNIFLITSWLDSVKANYLILNLSKNLDENNSWGPSEFLLNYCQQHRRCLLFKDTYHGINVGINKPIDYDCIGWNGHHGADGNRYFFEKSLTPLLKRNKFC
jgi:hypothetical protein